MYYGINQKVIESIVLDYIESGKLFNKIENELKEYIKDTIMGSVSEDYDTFQEIAEWIENHQGDINNIVELIKDKVNQEQIVDMATKTWVNENFLDEHQDLSKYDTIESVDGKIKDVRDDLDIAEKNIETIQGQVNTINENISDIKLNVSKIELNHTTDFNKISEDVSSLRSDVEEHKKTCDASILKVSTDFSELKSNHNKDMTSINTSISTNVGILNNKIDGVDSKIDSKIGDVKNEIQNIHNTDIVNLNLTISELTQKVESLQAELTQLKNSNLVKFNI